LHAQSLASAFCNEPEKMLRRFDGIVVLLTALVFAVAPCVAANDWTSYSNERYGFSLQYPADVFAPERSAEAGDGELFAAKDGDARLLVGTLSNASRFTRRATRRTSREIPMPTIVLTTAASAAAGLRYRARATARFSTRRSCLVVPGG
jgi:hypothetical protein